MKIILHPLKKSDFFLDIFQKDKVNIKKMEVDKNRICPHEILFEDCSKCQLLTFCKSGLLKVVTRSIIAPYVKEGNNSWIFTIRPFEEHLIKINDEYEYKYGGLVFLGKDCLLSKEKDKMSEEWPIYKIVFKGTFEALIGFISCFIMKYGQSSILKYRKVINIHEDYKDINDRLNDIWGAGDFYGTCIFNMFSKYNKAYQTYDSDEIPRYFATNNIEEFMAGYREMKDIFIPDVEYYKDGFISINDIGPVEYFIHKKETECSDPEFYPGCHIPIYEKEMEHDILNGDIVLPKCKAYFYKL